jgi:uncharacterized protein with HEPN domain
MAAPSLADRIGHSLDAIDRLEAMWAGKSFNNYLADDIRAAATERNLEKTFEASKHIPDADKAAHPQIPWRQVRAIGNILRHAYERVDPR